MNAYKILCINDKNPGDYKRFLTMMIPNDVCCIMGNAESIIKMATFNSSRKAE